MDLGFWTAGVIAAILVGMGKGGLPVVGMMSVPVLALVMNPVAAAGLLLPVYVISDMFGLMAYRSKFDARVLKIVVPAACFGIALGWATATVVPVWLVTLLVGLIGGVFAIYSLVRRPPEGPPREAKVAPGLFWGTICGFTSFVSHSGGPPWQVYVLPLRLDKLIFAGTGTIAFAIINAVKLIPYYFLGQLSFENMQYAAVLMVPASISVFIGVKLVKILPQKLFYQLVTYALLLLSLKLIYDALTA